MTGELLPPLSQPRKRERWLLGLDLGKERDPSALMLNHIIGCPGIYQLRRIEKWKLKTPYQVVVDETKEIMQNPRFAECDVTLVVDGTGVGDPVVEMMWERGLQPIVVKITSGLDPVTVHPSLYHVPKRLLAVAVHLALDSRRIKVSPGPYSAAFERELQTFAVKTTQARNDTYEAFTESETDDMVLGEAVAVWYGDNKLIDIPTCVSLPEQIPLGILN